MERVFDADNRRGDRCFHFTSFKSQVAAFHFAVNELQPLTVAQGLCPNNFAVFKGDVLAVPGQILTLDYTVSHGDVFRMPEGIFRIKGAVLEHRIFDVLEGVFSFHPYIVKVQVGRTHHEVFTFGIAILHLDVMCRPSELRREHIAAAHHNVRTLAQGLDPVKLRIFDGNVVGVPQSRPAKFRHLRITDDKAMVMPEGITQIEEAVFHLHIAALLKSALAISGAVKGAILYQNIVASVKGTLCIKGLILNHFHKKTSYNYSFFFSI